MVEQLRLVSVSEQPKNSFRACEPGHGSRELLVGAFASPLVGLRRGALEAEQRDYVLEPGDPIHRLFRQQEPVGEDQEDHPWKTLGHGQELLAHEGLAPGDDEERYPQLGRLAHDAAELGVAQLQGRPPPPGPPAPSPSGSPAQSAVPAPPRNACA